MNYNYRKTIPCNRSLHYWLWGWGGLEDTFAVRENEQSSLYFGQNFYFHALFTIILQLLARAFQDMGQDENNEYKQLALYLAGEFFLDHNNKDVRLLVACCMADIFRIFAPEAPFTEPGQLKVLIVLPI